MNIKAQPRHLSANTMDNIKELEGKTKSNPILKANPETEIKIFSGKRKKRIVTLLSEAEYARLEKFVQTHTPPVTISDIVRSGIEHILNGNE